MSGKIALVLGSGGREHALAWRLSQCSSVGKVHLLPGNGGTCTAPLTSHAIPVKGPAFMEVIDFCKKEAVDLVVVGPEVMLDEGIADALTAAGIPCFGPSKQAAQIESSKIFCKDLMARHKVPTAEYKSFKGAESLEAALKYVDEAPFMVVVKASGLAAGKGVIVPSSREEAKQAVRDFLEKGTMGEAGKEIVLEELMTGVECSVFACCDGKTFAVLPPAQDHKRIFDNDQGPNTGGMGAFAPTPFVTPELMKQINEEILKPTVEGMAADGHPFIGCLFAGLMLTDRGPRVIEFNARFGDPETEAIMTLIDSDLYEMLEGCAKGTLDPSKVKCKENTGSVTVVMASSGYPGKYEVGKPISGLEEAGAASGVVVFHAGTKAADGSILTSGGRVLAVTAVGSGLLEAKEKAYAAVSKISFEGAYFRKDIGGNLK